MDDVTTGENNVYLVETAYFFVIRHDNQNIAAAGCRGRESESDP